MLNHGRWLEHVKAEDLFKTTNHFVGSVADGVRIVALEVVLDGRERCAG